jgi:hypothetical protein
MLAVKLSICSDHKKCISSLLKSSLRIRIPGSEMEKTPDPGSGINIQDHISEILVTIFWVKNTVLKFFVADSDPVSGTIPFSPGSVMEKFGSEKTSWTAALVKIFFTAWCWSGTSAFHKMSLQRKLQHLEDVDSATIAAFYKKSMLRQ